MAVLDGHTVADLVASRGVLVGLLAPPPDETVDCAIAGSPILTVNPD
jgi:hypothetical protein